MNGANGEIRMVGWKRPENYIADENICCFDVREKVGCTEKFRESGLLKNGRWDYFAQYQMLCKNCPYFCKKLEK